MGNKVSTARKLQGGVAKSSETLVRSQINQLPSKSLKEKYENRHTETPTPNSGDPNQKSDASTPTHAIGENPEKGERDFLSAINKLGSIIETNTKASPQKLKSAAISQLQNRKRLEANEIFTSQQLNDLLLDLHDKRYTKEQVQKDNDLTDEWMEVLGRFKVADTYKIFKTPKPDAITHEGVKDERQFDDLEKDLEITQSDEIRDIKKLEERLK